MCSYIVTLLSLDCQEWMVATPCTHLPLAAAITTRPLAMVGLHKQSSELRSRGTDARHVVAQGMANACVVLPAPRPYLLRLSGIPIHCPQGHSRVWSRRQGARRRISFRGGKWEWVWERGREGLVSWEANVMRVIQTLVSYCVRRHECRLYGDVP